MQPSGAPSCFPHPSFPGRAGVSFPKFPDLGNGSNDWGSAAYWLGDFEQVHALKYTLA